MMQQPGNVDDRRNDGPPYITCLHMMTRTTGGRFILVHASCTRGVGKADDPVELETLLEAT